MNKLNYYFYFFLVSILLLVPTKTFSDNHNLNEILELIQKDLRTLERAVYSEDFTSSQENNENTNQKQEQEPRRIITKKIGRNEPCPCGSGKKYKQCHGG